MSNETSHGPIETKLRSLTESFARALIAQVPFLPNSLAPLFNKAAWVMPMSWPFVSFVRMLDGLIEKAGNFFSPSPSPSLLK